MSSATADEEFERLPDDYAVGTSKLYSRGDFLELDDPLAFDEGDFVGRLRALFGPSDTDQYVLRHRATSWVVTAYCAQSGPSYGGGPRYEGALPLPGTPSFADLFRVDEDSDARVAADPELAAGLPSERRAHRRARNDPAIRELDHRWYRRFADASAPEGFAAVVARLDALLSAVAPADWEAVRYSGEGPTLYRVGARDGVGFSHDLPIAESLEMLLTMAEHGDDAMTDTAGSPFGEPNMRAVSFWVGTMESLAWEDEEDEEDDGDEEEDGEEEDEEEDRDTKRDALRRALPRVQAAWFRSVERLVAYDRELRARLIELAHTQIVVLELDRDEAEEALKAVR